MTEVFNTLYPSLKKSLNGYKVSKEELWTIRVSGNKDTIKNDMFEALEKWFNDNNNKYACKKSGACSFNLLYDYKGIGVHATPEDNDGEYIVYVNSK